jgi:hypothetical protein
MEQITAKIYTLREEDGQWLAQVVLTSDGMFSSVTDYGNFSYAWRSFGPGTFREFLLNINEGYFGDKLCTGMAYIAYSKKVQHACDRYAKKILPALKKALRAEIEAEKNVNVD